MAQTIGEMLARCAVTWYVDGAYGQSYLRRIWPSISPIVCAISCTLRSSVELCLSRRAQTGETHVTRYG